MTSPDRDLSDPDPGAEGSRSSSSTSQRKHLPLWQETILLLGIALGLALVIKTLFAQAFYIPSESMEPGLVTQDRILVQKVSYWGGGEPERGDVVVFEDPGSWLGPGASQPPSNLVIKAMSRIGLYPTGGHLVKRVVGVAGDVVTCCDERGRIAVNGEPLDEEEYVKDDPGAVAMGEDPPAGVQCRGPMVRSCEWEAGPVPEGHVFVMGDNRAHSADSSHHMCTDEETDCVPGREFVPVDLVVGKVFVVLWPWDNFRWVGRPDAFDDVPAAP